MARPNKKGLDYFPLDTDFFEDPKIGAIAGEFGIKGEIVAVKLLCTIYREGYFVVWSDMLRLKFLREVSGINANLLDEIVGRLVRWGFFDESLFNSEKILTSKGIQSRYFNVAKRRIADANLPYLLVSVCNNSISVCNNSSDSKLLRAKTTQRKQKESKENTNSNELVQKNAATIVATPSQVRKDKFTSELVPFVETYGKQMIREFFDYWTELNPSKTKMRFELERTWELPKRLSTWAKREKVAPKRENNHGNQSTPDSKPSNIGTNFRRKTL